MPTILVIGSDGMLGFDLMRAFGSDAVGLTHRDIEVTDPASVRAAIAAHRPEIVITTAAILKTEDCERDPERCFRVNAIGALHVARACADIGATTIFISTDYVFGGGKASFTEEDASRPLNVYGASKAAGEQLVALANPKHYIIRSGWFFGDHVSHKGYDFPRLMLERARTQPFVAVVRDQRGTPTYTKDLALTIKRVIEVKAPFGAYHVANSDTVSWHEFAQLVFRQFGVHADLRAITTEESGTTIRRPDCTALSTRKLQALGIPPLRPLTEALREYSERLNALPDE